MRPWEYDPHLTGLAAWYEENEREYICPSTHSKERSCENSKEEDPFKSRDSSCKSPTMLHPDFRTLICIPRIYEKIHFILCLCVCVCTCINGCVFTCACVCAHVHIYMCLAILAIIPGVLRMPASTVLLSYIPRLGVLEQSLAMKLKVALNLLHSPDWS